MYCLRQVLVVACDARGRVLQVWLGRYVVWVAFEKPTSDVAAYTPAPTLAMLFVQLAIWHTFPLCAPLLEMSRSLFLRLPAGAGLF